MTALPTGSGLAIALAVVAAFCFAGAAVLQHRAVTAAAPVPGYGAPHRGRPGATLSLDGLLAATRRPGWLLGLALAGGGTLLHAAALVLAPLSVVQPIGVLAVPVAVLLTAVRTGRQPGRGVLAAAAVCVAGVAVFVGLAAGTAVSAPAPGGATLLAGLVVAAVVAALAAVGLDHSGWVRCVSLAAAGAVAFGLVSTLLRAVSQDVVYGGFGALLDPGVLATVAGIGTAVLVGGWLVQQAFASGPPEVVTACLTVVDPIVAVVLGTALLGEGAATPARTWLMMVAAAAAATAGVVALARHHPDVAARRAAHRRVADPGRRSSAADRTRPSLPSLYRR